MSKINTGYYNLVISNIYWYIVNMKWKILGSKLGILNDICCRHGAENLWSGQDNSPWTYNGFQETTNFLFVIFSKSGVYKIWLKNSYGVKNFDTIC